LKLRLVCVGKVSEAYLREGVEEYASRIKRYLPFETVELKEEKAGGRGADNSFIRDREGERILEKIPQGAFVVTLDERGRNVSSEGLADLLEKHMVQGTPEIAMVVGGPYGLSQAVKGRGNLQLSLSPMTFTHQMVRLILLEQIYRALTIIRHEPYHNR
jgi:23S rRNA (pseudouridine1915-N3)-methyltransferase